jgi:hypothetical protein
VGALFGILLVSVQDGVSHRLPNGSFKLEGIVIVLPEIGPPVRKPPVHL